jgi:hypothetical protein
MRTSDEELIKQPGPIHVPSDIANVPSPIKRAEEHILTFSPIRTPANFQKSLLIPKHRVSGSNGISILLKC